MRISYYKVRLQQNEYDFSQIFRFNIFSNLVGIIED